MQINNQKQKVNEICRECDTQQQSLKLYRTKTLGLKRIEGGHETKRSIEKRKKHKEKRETNGGFDEFVGVRRGADRKGDTAS